MLCYASFLSDPGLCVRVFSAFKCQTIASLQEDGLHSGIVMSEDFSVECQSPDHFNKGIIPAILFMLLWVLGIPLTVLFLLAKNRPSLYDKTHPQHNSMVQELGSLYLQCKYELDFTGYSSCMYDLKICALTLTTI